MVSAANGYRRRAERSSNFLASNEEASATAMLTAIRRAWPPRRAPKANNEARANLAAHINRNQEANDKPRWTR